MDHRAQQLLEGNLNGFAHRPPLSGSPKTGQNDLFIAVMGVTGSGKSTFISRCCPQAVPVGHGLQSHTSAIQIYPMQYNDKTIHLIDTPGFDDTYRPDVDVLKDLSYWLNKSYQEEIRLTGIIYLHRIIDPRLGGTARKNLEMFKKLCGADSYGAVVLATTMWERVPADEGDRREQELRTTGEFYKSMIDNGAHLMRHMDNRNSAMAIMSHLINRGRTTVLAMQHEMSEQNLELQQTAAGKELNSEILRQTEMFNMRLRETEARMQQALEEKDDQLARDLASQQDELNQRILEAQRGREELQVTMQNLFQEKEKQFNEMKKQYEEERKQREEALQQRDEQLNEFKKALKRAEELAAAKMREYEEEIALRKQQLEETEGVVGELYLRNVEALIAQKDEYDKKVRENLARAQEEEYRQRSERMKQEYETNLNLVRQRQILMQQPAFYPGAVGNRTRIGTMVAGSAAGAVAAHIAPVAIGAVATMCVVM